MLTDGRTRDAGVSGILKTHLGAFGSGDLIMKSLSNMDTTSSITVCKKYRGMFFLYRDMRYLQELQGYE